VTTAALQDLFLPDNRCFGCGPGNAAGLHLKSYEREGRYLAEWTAEERFEGPPGHVNGGVMAVPMDCHGTWAAMHTFSRDRGGEPVGAVTAGYNVRLLEPTPVGHRIEFVAEVVEHDDHKARVDIVARVEDTVVANYTGYYVVVDAFE
jgi:acyl-coenzyme A thioesterase PaaI-like protein